MMLKINYDIVASLNKNDVINVNESVLNGQLCLMPSLSEQIGSNIYIGKERYSNHYKLFSAGGWLIAEYDDQVSTNGEISLSTFNKLVASHIAKEPEYLDHLPVQFFSSEFCKYVMTSYKQLLERKIKPVKNIFGRPSNKELKSQLKEMNVQLKRHYQSYERNQQNEKNEKKLSR